MDHKLEVIINEMCKIDKHLDLLHVKINKTTKGVDDLSKGISKIRKRLDKQNLRLDKIETDLALLLKK